MFLRCVPASLALVVLATSGDAQNSTKKIRVAPSRVAEAVGEDVPWLTDFEVASAKAEELGRPLFWYVPTVAGSPMDRTEEIDRRMRGGPFSWPSTIDLLKSHFVCLRLAPSGALQQRFRLTRGNFVEPGYLVLGPDGSERMRLHSCTTFHPEWFEAPLRRVCGLPDPGFPCTGELRAAWDEFRAGRFDECQRALVPEAGVVRSPAVEAEARFLAGAALRSLGRCADARDLWRRCGEELPDTGFGRKCALEAEGHGPFVRGFERFHPLRERVLRDLDEGSRAPRGTFTEEQLWQHGVAFLLAMADEDGIVRDSIYDFGGTDSLPNVHVAISFLCGEALLHAARRCADGSLALEPELLLAVEARLAQLRTVAQSDAHVALEDRDEIVWARAYRARFLARWAELRGDADEIRALLGPAVAALSALQPETGMWFHEYGNAFAVATALSALAAARDAGVAIDEQIVARGLGALERCRTKEGAYTYADPGRRRASASIVGSAGRMPLCELARFTWGRSDEEALAQSLVAAFAHHPDLLAVRKYDDHADRHGYGGFFFWFDMLGRTEAIVRTAKGSRRDLWMAQQKKLVLDLPEFDGCFVDSHELGRCYGTAMALLCLAALGD